MRQLGGSTETWTTLHQLIDDQRRTALALAGDKNPAPHPLSPAGAAKRARDEAEQARRKPLIEAAKRRARERAEAIASGELI